jgi:hypothetical protein
MRVGSERLRLHPEGLAKYFWLQREGVWLRVRLLV